MGWGTRPPMQNLQFNGGLLTSPFPLAGWLNKLFYLQRKKSGGEQKSLLFNVKNIKLLYITR